MIDGRLPLHPRDGSRHTRTTWPDVGVLALGMSDAVFLTKFCDMGPHEAAITAVLTIAAMTIVTCVPPGGVHELLRRLRVIATHLASISATPAAPTATAPPGVGHDHA